jgi:hypothetical protein
LGEEKKGQAEYWEDDGEPSTGRNVGLPNLKLYLAIGVG